MSICPFFGRCGGCKFDFAAPDYHDKKVAALPALPTTDVPIWIDGGQRRRADFCFAGGNFGFFESRTKNIIPVTNCPNLTSELNAVLPELAQLPWGGAGSCLVTLCDNGIDVNITSSVPYVTPDFRRTADKLPVIRVTWNDKIVFEKAKPVVSFGDTVTDFPPNAFLQPTVAGADTLRDMVVRGANGAKRVADLFCGLGNFTFALNADGFDVVGTGTKRDLFKKPLTVGMLNTYDCVVMDPPRAGADAQCRELIKSDVKRIIYVSCNPQTFRHDTETLTRGGYELKTLIPVDQFVGSAHWEIFSIFEK